MVSKISEIAHWNMTLNIRHEYDIEQTPKTWRWYDVWNMRLKKRNEYSPWRCKEVRKRHQNSLQIQPKSSPPEVSIWRLFNVKQLFFFLLGIARVDDIFTSNVKQVGNLKLHSQRAAPFSVRLTFSDHIWFCELSG